MFDPRVHDSAGILRLAVGLLGVVLGAASLAAEQTPAATVTLRVYDSLHLSQPMSIALRAATEDALAPAGVAIRWLACVARASGLTGPCATTPGRHDVVVRVVASHDRRDPERCGFSLPLTGGPAFVSLARECAARVSRALESAQAGMPVMLGEARILGYTLAHELAHVLLPGRPHSRDGIFTARLDRRHWTGVLSGRLSFLEQDIEQLRTAAVTRQAAVASEARGRVAATDSRPRGILIR